MHLPVVTLIVLRLGLLLLLSASPTYSSSSVSASSFLYAGCSQMKYSTSVSSYYQSNINALLTSILSSSSINLYNNSSVSAQGGGSSPLYGIYQCRGDLSVADCYRCMQAAVSQIGTLCANACGGAIQLQGCFLKYDNATFIGVPDKTVVENKCAPASGGYQTDLLSRRDEVLAELGGGSGSFRVASVGYVSGMAQCIGDLSPAMCSDCLSEAADRLRGGCGASLSGDMYLAKCYVRYTATGVYTAKPGNEGSSNDSGKTLAIMIGLLASVALIIIFLSFLGKMYDGKGK